MLIWLYKNKCWENSQSLLNTKRYHALLTLKVLFFSLLTANFVDASKVSNSDLLRHGKNQICGVSGFSVFFIFF